MPAEIYIPEHNPPCSVAQETIDAVAALYPKIFMDKHGNVEVNREGVPVKVLFALGFDIKQGELYNGIYTYRGDKDYTKSTESTTVYKGVLIRDSARPSKVYRTRCLYNGNLRYETERVTKRGKIIYGPKLHWLAYAHEKHEVLLPSHLEDIVPPKDWLDILTIGQADAYNKGLLEMDTPNSKTKRNIVRGP